MTWLPKFLEQMKILLVWDFLMCGFGKPSQAGEKKRGNEHQNKEGNIDKMHMPHIFFVTLMKRVESVT